MKNKKRKKRVSTPTIFQMEMTECGAASLTMIMHYYGVCVPLERVRMDTGVSRDGCRASKIIQGAKKYNFDVHGYRMELSGLLKVNPPCIIHWNFNHFVVYEGISGNYVYINDPAQGKRKLTIKELDESFTGIVITIEPTKDILPIVNPNSVYSSIISIIKNYKKEILYLLLLGSILVIPGLIIPLLSQFFIDRVLIGGRKQYVNIVLIALFFTALIQMLLTIYRDLIILKLQMKMMLTSAYNFIKHMLSLPMSFYSQRYSGDLVARINNNDSVNQFVAGDLGINILNIVMAIFYMCILAVYNAYLTAVGSLIVIINIIVLKIVSNMLSKTIFKIQQDEGRLTGVLYSGLGIISTLKASGIENKYTSRVLGFYSKYLVGKQNNAKIQNIVNAIPDITSGVTNILVLVIGGCFVITGEMTVGSLVAFSTIFGFFIEPVNGLIRFVVKLQTIKADISRVQDILNYGNQIGPNEVTIRSSDEKLKGEIEFEGISFGYSPLEKPLIEDFSFVLEPGKSIALVGSSGSGKSTISKIASGLYSPWSGNVKFDGLSINEISPEVRACSIATVSQEITLFTGTIRQNISLWNKAIQEEDIIQAAKDAQIHEVIVGKPEAYDYHLTEGGRNLSGGQRQRIELARALATTPSILIMDEATSALDAITEKAVVDCIRKRGCACIIVAHRLSVIRDCDEIIVMDQGKIAQRGTHEELAACEGIYKNLFVKGK